MAYFEAVKLLLCFSSLFTFFCSTGSYDLFDPSARVAVRWDIMEWTPDGYVAIVTISNLQKYRHIEEPGWILGWSWSNKEFIWQMLGAETRDQGDCSMFMKPIPHCCKGDPEVIDLLPNDPVDMQVENCCKGGVLSSSIQNSSKSTSRFQLIVGGVGTNKTNIGVPQNFTLKAPGPGYTCRPAEHVSPTIFYSRNGRRTSPAFKTWNITCTYSRFIATENPTCCVSLSAFYNKKIVDCLKCACGCHNARVGSSCAESNTLDESNSSPVIQCTNHMCPVRVHWHIEQNYREYWRVKITVTNFNNNRNYSDWNVVLQHPNLNNVTSVYSFNYHPLAPYRINDTGMLWGLPYFNDILLQAGQQGYVQSKILFGRNRSEFTLENGWGFPRRVYFNGDECVMPYGHPHLPPPSPRSSLPVLDPAMVIMVFLVGYVIVGAFCKRL